MKPGHGTSPETEDLKRQIKFLQSKLDKQDQLLKQQQKQRTTQPVTSSGMPSRSVSISVQSQEEVIRWEESKKWQKRVETLKNKLSDKARECEALIKQVTSLRETVTRYQLRSPCCCLGHSDTHF